MKRNFDAAGNFTGYSSKLRRFTERGNLRYKELVESHSKESPQNVPDELLFDDEFSEEIGTDVILTQREYETQYDLVEHYYPAIRHDFGKELSPSEIMRSDTVFNWVSAFFFGSLGDPEKVIDTDYYYFLSFKSEKQFDSSTYRNKIFGWYMFYQYHMEESFLALSRHPNVYGDICEGLLARSEFRFSSGFLATFNRLYSVTKDANDVRKTRLLKGRVSATGPLKGGKKVEKWPGSFRRCIKRYQQLSRTFDIHHMPTDEVSLALGDEFVFTDED
ncbi:MAG: hypothetical protein CMJ72_15900 [Planctomycetaceae bacterium]|nr:hypothetical protein [Planctomycetaceae bacterium]